MMTEVCGGAGHVMMEVCGGTGHVMMEAYGATSRTMTEWEEKPFISKLWGATESTLSNNIM